MPFFLIVLNAVVEEKMMKIIFILHPDTHPRPSLHPLYPSHLLSGEMSPQLFHPVTHQHCDRLTFGSFVITLICSFLSFNTAGWPRSVIPPVLSGCEQNKHVQRQETHSIL